MDAEQKHVLVVDDDEALCEALSTKLAWAGYSVASVSDGRSALRRCAARVPDAIILDVMLPDIDGYEVCRAIRNDPSNDRAAILFLTGKTRDRAGYDDALLDRLGGQFFLEKPYDAQRLISLLDSITGHRDEAGTDNLFAWSLN